MSRVEIVIVGGGPAGAAAAYHLARAGLEPWLIERDAAPKHRVCGEFLSATALDELARMEITPFALGARRLSTLQLCLGTRQMENRLPFPAFGLSRRCLDVATLSRAEAAGAKLLTGLRLRRLDPEDGGFRLGLSDGRRLRCRSLFLATGKLDLAGERREPGGQAQGLPERLGFKLHLRPDPAGLDALAERVVIAQFPGGYAGLAPIEAGRINLCLAVETAAYRARADWPSFLAWLTQQSPALARHLAGAEACWPKPLAVARTPYGFLRRKTSGPWWLGDQAAVIPSFAGEGLAIALASGRLAAESYIAGGNPASFQAELAHRLAPAMAVALRLDRLLASDLLRRPALQAAWAGPALQAAGPLLRAVLRQAAQRTRIAA